MQTIQLKEIKYVLSANWFLTKPNRNKIEILTNGIHSWFVTSSVWNCWCVFNCRIKNKVHSTGIAAKQFNGKVKLKPIKKVIEYKLQWNQIRLKLFVILFDEDSVCVSLEKMLRIACLLILLGTAAAFEARTELEEFICFGKPTDALIPHPNECNSFFMCDGGVGYKHNCPNNTFFNPIDKQCDINYNCDYPPTDQPTNDTIESNTLFPTLSTSSIILPSTPTAEVKIKCPSEDTRDLTFLRSRSQCNEFFLCYYAKPVKFECAGGYHFSEVKRACVPEAQSSCYVTFYVYNLKNCILIRFYSLQIPPSNSSLNPVCPKGVQRFFPHPRNCANFFYCENGHKTVQRCQPFYHWDITKKRCLFRTRAICIDSIPKAMQRAFY